MHPFIHLGSITLPMYGLCTMVGTVFALIAVFRLQKKGSPITEDNLLDALTDLLAPLLRAAGLPPETAGLMLLRPLSGSGALAFATELIRRWGPDSLQGRVAAVMLGGTETTFYVVSVYFGAAGIRRTRHAIPAALAADLAGFLCAGIFVHLFFY